MEVADSDLTTGALEEVGETCASHDNLNVEVYELSVNRQGETIAEKCGEEVIDKSVGGLSLIEDVPTSSSDLVVHTIVVQKEEEERLSPFQIELEVQLDIPENDGTSSDGVPMVTDTVRSCHLYSKPMEMQPTQTVMVLVNDAYEDAKTECNLCGTMDVVNSYPGTEMVGEAIEDSNAEPTRILNEGHELVVNGQAFQACCTLTKDAHFPMLGKLLEPFAEQTVEAVNSDPGTEMVDEAPTESDAGQTQTLNEDLELVVNGQGFLITIKSEPETSEEEQRLHWEQAYNVPSHNYEEVIDRNFKLEFANDMEELEDEGGLYPFETELEVRLNCTDTGSPSSSIAEDVRTCHPYSKPMDKQPTQTVMVLVEDTKSNVKNKHQCNVCGKVCKNRSRLLMHMNCHTGKRPFKCDVCGKNFTRKANLKQHSEFHTGILRSRPHQCTECGKGFLNKSSLGAHMRYHTGERPYKCEQCGKAFHQKSGLVVHKKFHFDERPFKCDICDKGFHVRSGLVTHQKFHIGERPFACKQCGKAFHQKSGLLAHIQSHTGERPFECKECGKAFMRKSHLKSHTKIHSGERPFSCKECDKAFMSKSNLTQHMRCHIVGQNARPHKCPECDKAFRWKPDLMVHRRLHTDERPHKCEECGKAFNKKSGLVVHQRLHTGEKPFSCEQCGKAFSNKSGLASHRTIHFGGRQFECMECGKTFVQRLGLLEHIRSHTGERPYECTECGKSFCRKSVLTVHQGCHSAEKRFKCKECDKGFSRRSDLTTHLKMHNRHRRAMERVKAN
uniref:zinc finger protein 345-like isoform X2 n=1 Tax=Myxine glutinosa TaxID=7769 RepID=UPI00358F71C5